MVAWYGAIIVTIVVAVSIYNALRDSSQVVLKFGRNFCRHDEWDNPLFYISVTNRGRRPVKIDKSWVKVYGYNGKVLLTDSLTTSQERTLDERNPKITFWTRENTMDVGNIYCIYASDNTEKVYKKYTKTFPTITKLWWFVVGKKSDGVKK